MERREDILPLVHHFVSEFCRQYGLERRISERVMRKLHDHSWPGNVRELKNVVERLVVTSPSPLIGLQDLEGVLEPQSVGTDGKVLLRERLEKYEQAIVEEALRKHGNTRSAATALGISQSSVVRKVKLTEKRH
jgi:DNA-binding NtrC family response regulator